MKALRFCQFQDALHLFPALLNCLGFFIFRGRFFHGDVLFFSFFKLAGDKSEQDAKLRRMADEIERLKDKLARQENLEDEVLQIVKTYAKLHWPPMKELR